MTTRFTLFRKTFSTKFRGISLTSCFCVVVKQVREQMLKKKNKVKLRENLCLTTSSLNIRHETRSLCDKIDQIYPKLDPFSMKP